MLKMNARDEQGTRIPFCGEEVPVSARLGGNTGVAGEPAGNREGMLQGMIWMAQLRDPRETGGHVNRVAGYSVEIYQHWARRQGISAREIERRREVLYLAAMLHDVGKVAISDLILRKPGPLSLGEYNQMKQHTVLGARLFGNTGSAIDDAAAEVALTHHERWDGTGYPGFVDIQTGRPLPGYEQENGSPRPKRGGEIPALGRVVALADVYDALSSARCYKEAWGQEQILNAIRQDAGTQFDPEMVDAFFSCLGALHAIRDRHLD